MNRRLDSVKTILWTIMGVLAVVTVARYVNGLGAVTNLSDATPWGLWIAFDVMAGVALAAGGFTLAATVYIFGLTRYRPFVRPAILTAFLGYIAVAVGLLYDLGLPWHIWHPLVYPQSHSVLFEVAMCVMLYLTVLALEFSPVILEHRWFDRPAFRAAHRVLKRATIPLVIAGIMLSTLHQSSLGSLFLIAPFRVHPLWYSPLIWILFLISAVGMGLMMVTLESYVSAWLFGHTLPSDRLAGLGRAASVVLLVYAGLRLGDLAWRDQIGLALQATPMAALFWFELAVGAIIPGLLLAVPAVRRHALGLGLIAGMVVLGIIGYRFNVSIVAFSRPAGAGYFPSWVEFVVSAGIVAGALLVFIFFVEQLRVYEPDHTDARPTGGVLRTDPYGAQPRLPRALAAPRRQSLAFVVGAAAAWAFLPGAAIFGAPSAPVPVAAARAIEGTVTQRGARPGHDFTVVPSKVSVPDPAARDWLLLIDGNRDGRLVVFPHDRHQFVLGGTESCSACHHANLPFSRGTACAACHRDMYSPSDTFAHTTHIKRLGGNDGCVRCHADQGVAKTRTTTTPCTTCHAGMFVAGSRVRPTGTRDGQAASYLDAMHRLCITCHTERMKTDPAKHPVDFAECRGCHRDADGRAIERLEPYSSGARLPSSVRLER